MSTPFALLLSLRRAGVIALALAISACTGTSASPSPTRSAPSVATATASPTASSAPTPGQSIEVATMGAIPRRVRYAVLGNGPVARVWLVDLEARVMPRLVIRLEHMGNGELSVSGDGQVIALSAPGAHGHRAVHVVRPATGARSVVYEEPDAQVGGTPIVTRAGDRYAFAKQLGGVTGFSGGRADLGLWIGSTNGGAPRRVVAGGAAVPSVPLAWSPDGQQLAFVRGAEIFVLAPDGSEHRAGAGVDASWLSNTALLIARGPATPSGIDRYDIDGGTAHAELSTTGSVLIVLADPTGRRYAYIERTGREDLLTLGTVWLRDAAGGAARDLGASRVRDLEWSADGVALTGIAGGDDSNTRVSDLLGGPGAGLCTRSDYLPQASPGGCV